MGTNARGDRMLLWVTDKTLWARRATARGWDRATPVQIGTQAPDALRIALDPSGNALTVWRGSDAVRPNPWSSRFSVETLSWGRRSWSSAQPRCSAPLGLLTWARA
jgi:hypothetical protein